MNDPMMPPLMSPQQGDELYAQQPPDVVLVPVPADGGGEQRAALPTYQTVADVLEKKNGSGWRLAGWTVARTALIAIPMMVVVEPKKAILGSALASAAISVLTLARIKHAGDLAGVPQVGGVPKTRGPYRGRGYYR